MNDVIRPSLHRVAISFDIGLVPHPHEYGGQYVITIQAAPLPNLPDARSLCEAMKEAIESRLGIAIPIEHQRYPQ